jgi:hypothetical protein
MLKTKGFVISSYIIHHSKSQLGNTLIPVIIALAISAVASVAFLRQGADLSAQAKVLEAQYEVAAILQEWNRLKSSGGIASISAADFPSATYRTNTYGGNVEYIPRYTPGGVSLRHSPHKTLKFMGITGGVASCEKLLAIFFNAEGVNEAGMTWITGTVFSRCITSRVGTDSELVLLLN